MKRTLKIAVVLVVTLQFSPFVQSQNLIQNNSCDAALFGGNIPFWQDINGFNG